MTRYIHIILALVFINLASACFDAKDVSSLQAESFMKYYNNYPVFSASDARETNEGYALLGTVENSVGATRICLLRTDEYGNQIDSAYFGAGSNSKAHCLQVLSDGGFGILGSSINEATSKRQVYFIRTNANGEVLWQRTIGHTGNVEPMHFEVNGLGQFIITGYCEESNTDLTRQIWLGSLDDSGNQPWVPKITSFPRDAEGRHLQILSDNNMVITGASRNDASDPNNYTHAFVLLTNATGGPLEVYYIPASSNEAGNSICAIDNQHFLITGTVETSSSNSDIMLVKVNRESSPFTTEWSRTYLLPGNDVGTQVLTQGSQICVLSTTATVGTNTAISVMMTDLSGNNELFSSFGLGTQLTASSMERTADQGFIISGNNKLNENSTSATLIRTRNTATL